MLKEGCGRKGRKEVKDPEGGTLKEAKEGSGGRIFLKRAAPSQQLSKWFHSTGGPDSTVDPVGD
jgi:hypothetical protein